MNYLEQKTINTLVLAHYFRIAQTDNSKADEVAVAEAFGGRVGTVRIKLAIETLEESSYITDVGQSDYIYEVTATGYSRAEELFLKPDSAVKFIVEHGLLAYLDRLNEKGEDANDTKDIPAADRYVTLSDNMAGYEELISTISEANEGVRGSNELIAEERSWIKIHVDLGIELIRKGGRVLTSAIKSLLIEPLQAALKESSEENLKLAIRAALKAIKVYLGL